MVGSLLGIGVVVYLVLLAFGIREGRKAKKAGREVEPAVETTIFWVCVLVPIAGALIGLIYLRRLNSRPVKTYGDAPAPLASSADRFCRDCGFASISADEIGCRACGSQNTAPISA